jgi:hypothetical protein
VIAGKDHLLTLLNGLYDRGETTISVQHPCDEIGELLTIRLEDGPEATVSMTKSRYDYEDAIEEVQRRYDQRAYEDLPDPQSYVRTLIAGGLFDVANRDDVDAFLRHHGYPDLEAGHDPVMAGLDANLFGFRMPTVLGLDPDRDGRWKREGRPPVTGFVVSSGVKSELDWHYKHHDTRQLTEAFGEEFDRLNAQPAGDNRKGFLGLYEFRDLMAQRQTDFAYSDTGDAAIVQGYDDYMDEHRKEVLLFSNDTGFVERANDMGVKAQKVAFPHDVGQRETVSWTTACTLLYMFAVVFGVVVLPKVTIYGVWNGKDGSHWKRQQVVLDVRSPPLADRLERDQTIVDAYEAQ